MLAYILRRIVLLVPVLLGLSMLVFAIGRLLPGDPVLLAAGPNASKEEVAALSAEFGLDQPIPVQYWRYMQRAAQGDFGVSTQVLPGEDALDIFLTRLPATLELSFFALVIAIALGIPLGYLAARRKGTAIDNTTVIFSLVGVAVPVFFTAFLLKYFFAVEWNLLPVSGRQSTGC